MVVSTVEFEQLLAAHVLSGWERQLFLPEELSSGWELDLETATVTLEGGRVCRVQLLGTQSEVSDTWRWAWANEELPPAATELARSLRDTLAHVAEFAVEQLSLEHVEAYELAMVARGVAGAAAYLRCGYEGGAAYVLLLDADLYEAPEMPIARLATLLGQVLEAEELKDPSASVLAWARDQALEATPTEEGLIVRSDEGDEISLTFDAEGQIVGMRASLTGRGEGTHLG